MRISDWSSDVCSSDLPIVTTGPHDAIAEVDRAALELVLGHLIQNAIEASPPTEPVTLAVSTDGERVAIDVIDRGCGMTPAFVRDQLFRPFVSSKPGGFGIGAFEARQLTAALGGVVGVARRSGEQIGRGSWGEQGGQDIGDP